VKTGSAARPSTQKEIARLVDRYGEIQRQLALQKPITDEAKVLREKLLEAAASDPDGAVVLEGNTYQVTVGPPANERTIRNISGLAKRLGKALFLQLIRIPVTELEKHLQPAEAGKWIETARTGRRDIKAVALREAA
jgi:hypothetical protein